MTGTRMASTALAAAVALLAAAPSAALAEGETVVSYSGDPGSNWKISVSAAAGEANQVAVRSGGNGCTAGFVCIADTSAGVTESSSQCNQPAPNLVRCLSGQGISESRLEVRARDGRDVVSLNFRDYCITIIIDLVMGRGKDSSSAAVTCSDDSKPGGGGLGASLGPGPDTFQGGALGEGWSDFKSLISGGRGNDLVRTSFASFGVSDEKYHLVSGGGGEDLLRIGAGRGTIRGGAAADVLRGGLGPQRIFGGRGNDTISCGKGKDLGNGGPGRDLRGGGCERWVDMQAPGSD